MIRHIKPSNVPIPFCGIRIALISIHGNPLVSDTELGSDGKGGQNIYVREVGKELSTENCDVTWFTRSESPTEEGVVHLSPTLRCRYLIAGPQKHINRDFMFPYLAAFASQIDTSNFDVLLTNYWLSGAVGLDLRASSHLPLLHIHHSLGAMKYEHITMPEIGPLRLRFENKINSKADCLIHQTCAEVELCKATNPCLIKAGINSKHFEKDEKKRIKATLGFRDDTVNVLFAGRFAPQKGICFAIEAMRDTTTHHHFRLVGDYSSMPDLIALNAPNLEFLGPKTQEELAKYMIASDVFIMPSLYEPFGIAAIEAMAAGCCLIVSATGGLDEIVQNGVNGLKVQPGDSTAILEAFEKLVADPERMAEMGKTNINEAKKYSWHFTAKNIKHEIDKLVNNSN